MKVNIMIFRKQFNYAVNICDRQLRMLSIIIGNWYGIKNFPLDAA